MWGVGAAHLQPGPLELRSLRTSILAYRCGGDNLFSPVEAEFYLGSKIRSGENTAGDPEGQEKPQYIEEGDEGTADEDTSWGQPIQKGQLQLVEEPQLVEEEQADDGEKNQAKQEGFGPLNP